MNEVVERPPIVHDQRAMLRVKVKSLGAEARIIRKEELRAKRTDLREALYHHRIGIVRHEARHAGLALGFIKGRRLSQMERGLKPTLDWEKIRKMLLKYGAKGMIMPPEMPLSK